MSKNVEVGLTKYLDIFKYLYYIKIHVFTKGGKQIMEYKKQFFGRVTIDQNDSEELNEKIELEYYETRNLTEINERKYGIEIIKKKEESEKFNIESKIVNNISSKEQEINKLLNILMANKVTPISVDDVISDIFVTE